ncbi:hypothetical protein T02_11634 [Trichinella nativa]|uniref:SGF29 C-terminal domain-containing protein n=1 Tax=Trichinella nativa TaxID=6335 RepID=A0A0V1KUU8_9BILA|nr:hypothetical protein T02_11634 [Trichinella nativa]
MTKLSSWCSGHHICLTRRRSLVRAQARTNCFTRLSMFGAKNSKMDKNKANCDPCIFMSLLLHYSQIIRKLRIFTCNVVHCHYGSRSVVVITSASHAEGPWFEPSLLVALDIKCCDGPVVKALDLKSIRIFPRRFKSYSQRYFGITFLESMILCDLIIKQSVQERESVAARVKNAKGGENWILAKVKFYNSVYAKYKVEDTDEEE